MGGVQKSSGPAIAGLSLAANELFLAESDYGQPASSDPRKPLSVTAWAQHVPDNFATVGEAAEALRKEPFFVVEMKLPGGQPVRVRRRGSAAAARSPQLYFRPGG